MEEPRCRRIVDVCKLAERCNISFCEGAANRFEFLLQTLSFGPLVDVLFWKAAQDDVRSDKVDEDETALLSRLTVALVVSFFESELCSVKVVVGEVVATEIVEKGGSLSGGVERKRRRLLVNQGEDLLSASELPTVEEEFEADVGHEVNTNSSTFWLPVTVET